ncbi:MAG: hypothetical protein QOF76_3591 [Solirubrobacteraceae bacterium]|jgi:S1-C subfamily serine protease|nr:hypothetical protein [Solirubrobacteraceae bacterium]
MLQVTDVQEVIGRVAARVGPVTVGLERGSGVVIGRDRVLTSAHVLRAAELRIAIGGHAVPARVVAIDPEVGLAVLDAPTGDAAPVEWAVETSSGATVGATPDDGGAAIVSLGQPVLALADPGGRGLRVTLGAVAAPPQSMRGPGGRRIAGAIEHTAPLPARASGAPLTDIDGRLVGINTARLEGGFILALPADAAMRARVERLAGARQRPQLGLALARPRNRADGLVVRAVQDASPAAVAGIQRGDLLIAVAGLPVHQLDDVLDAVEACAGALTLTVIRNRTQRDAELQLLQ